MLNLDYKWIDPIWPDGMSTVLGQLGINYHLARLAVKPQGSTSFIYKEVGT